MKNLTRSTTVTVLLFLMAVLLLGFGSIGGARAALSLQSDIYESQLETTSINVAITENGKVVSETVVYSDGVGRLQFFNDGTMQWQDEQEADRLAGMTFEKLD